MWVRGYTRELVVTLIGALALSFAFRTAAFAVYYIPSESMVPTLEVGDRIAVSKYSYGWGRYSVPGLTLPARMTGRVFSRLPERGDIAVFARPTDGEAMVKRVIGLPGDRIEINRGKLVINGTVVARRHVRTFGYREDQGRAVSVNQFTEVLPGGRSYTILQRAGRTGADSMDEIVVPEGRLFMMGDNRDNSADSRFELGAVPIANLIGRGEAILFSLKTCMPEPELECAHRRYFSRLH